LLNNAILDFVDVHSWFLGAQKIGVFGNS